MTQWNSETLKYDLAKYDIPAWVSSKVREVAPYVTDLTQMHNQLTVKEIATVQRHVQGECGKQEFKDLIDAFMLEYMPGLIDNKRFMVQRFGTLRCVVPNQHKAGRLLRYHQGIWVGNGRGIRTVWMPMTETYDTNSMQILPLEPSREITQRIYREKPDYGTIQSWCSEHAEPVIMSPGQAHLFNQEQLHGNVNNETDITRVSMDLRILIEGEEFHRKLPGGYFRFPGEKEDGIDAGTDEDFVVSYAGWNSDWVRHIPLPQQRLQIDDFCNGNMIRIDDYHTELEYLDWCPYLESLLSDKYDAIIMFSLWALPDDTERRTELLYKAVNNNVKIHFVNELFTLTNTKDIAKVNDIRNFAIKTQHGET